MTDGESYAAEICDKVRTHLEWRGPNGKAMGHVVLTRREARVLVAFVDRLLEEQIAFIADEKWRDKF